MTVEAVKMVVFALRVMCIYLHQVQFELVTTVVVVMRKVVVVITKKDDSILSF